MNYSDCSVDYRSRFWIRCMQACHVMPAEGGSKCCWASCFPTAGNVTSCALTNGLSMRAWMHQLHQFRFHVEVKLKHWFWTRGDYKQQTESVESYVRPFASHCHDHKPACPNLPATKYVLQAPHRQSQANWSRPRPQVKAVLRSWHIQQVWLRQPSFDSSNLSYQAPASLNLRYRLSAQQRLVRATQEARTPGTFAVLFRGKWSMCACERSIIAEAFHFEAGHVFVR